MINLKKHAQISLGYFLLAALLGVFLRFFFVTSIPANFRYVVHAHSHIALLGWVYLGLSTLIYKMYFQKAGTAKTYRRIFWFTQVTLLGMLFTFPFTGYAALSITFSTLFLFASYLFTWFVLKKVPEKYKRTASFRSIKGALWYLVFSSIGPWALGGIMATLGKTSIWYKMAIYFYLHFQYNGWFILALCGVLFYFLEKLGLAPRKKDFSRFFYLLNAGVILSFFLSVLWIEPHWIFYALGALGAILQLMAFFEFFGILRNKDLQFSPFVKSLLKIAALLLAVKIILQLFSAHPFFAELAFTYTDFVIGYLHWTFLGLVSITLFAFFEITGLLKVSKMVFWIYFVGFALTEALIFYKGTSIWLGWPFVENYFTILAIVSGLLPLSLAIMLTKNLLTKE
ncbi:hypothetical protein SAMN04488034_101119 [Salinimicrobium catena]|uniref:Cytochrome C and Quinol oxidase polypeptide I n=1 Tax=Salinimicrobium catena TaxID=390640 RepID=A0A1H5HB11_9FLAO|nr:hypothetical protein [Salinimicrobium catena]SDK68886.1 hypothetical protein SAMN04488140_101119 [Salinimicrobium catena]SEE25100.1 hypothetical protein SAMN04488034_101119 [Salinimicrobium catena]